MRDATAPGLYLHVPFCSAICPYCDFSVLTGGAERRAAFADTLRQELDLWGERLAGGSSPGTFAAAAIDSVYLGGGTPSSLLPSQLAAILEQARARLAVTASAWLAMEANPEDVTPGSLGDWRALGVHTLTLGVQSFDDAALRFLGRRHDAAQARRAVKLALAAGFATLGVDLIYGLPGQEAEAWDRDLEAAIELGPQHLSCYQLSVQAGTPFGFRRQRGELRELGEHGQAALFRITHRRLAAAGYAAYEVSSFSRGESHRSRHNGKYWRHVPYLGVGPSAHSFDGRRRSWNHRKLGDWERAIHGGAVPVAGEEVLGPGELALEVLMLGLRTREGVELGRLQALGFDLPAANGPLLARLQHDRLLRLEEGRLVPTLEGWAVADGLAAAFDLPTAPAQVEGSAPPVATRTAGGRHRAETYGPR